MVRFKYVLFDLDGTLLNTRNGVIAAAINAIRKCNREIPDRVILESLIGPPMQTSFKKIYNLSDNKAMEMANIFRTSYMRDEYLFQATPYDGIFDLLSELAKSDIKIGIATYKRDDYAKKLLIEKGFNHYTNHIFGSDFEGKLSKTDIIRMCLADVMCTDYSEAVYIGDSPSDGKGAFEAGISFIGVTYGFGFKTVKDVEKYNPIAVADNCEQLKKILI